MGGGYYGKFQMVQQEQKHLDTVLSQNIVALALGIIVCLEMFKNFKYLLIIICLVVLIL